MLHVVKRITNLIYINHQYLVTHIFIKGWLSFYFSARHQLIQDTTINRMVSYFDSHSYWILLRFYIIGCIYIKKKRTIERVGRIYVPPFSIIEKIVLHLCVPWKKKWKERINRSLSMRRIVEKILGKTWRIWRRILSLHRTDRSMKEMDVCINTWRR